MGLIHWVKHPKSGSIWVWCLEWGMSWWGAFREVTLWPKTQRHENAWWASKAQSQMLDNDTREVDWVRFQRTLGPFWGVSTSDCWGHWVVLCKWWQHTRKMALSSGGWSYAGLEKLEDTDVAPRWVRSRGSPGGLNWQGSGVSLDDTVKEKSSSPPKFGKWVAVARKSIFYSTKFIHLSAQT